MVANENRRSNQYAHQDETPRGRYSLWLTDEDYYVSAVESEGAKEPKRSL